VANLFVNLPIPAGDGSGAAVDCSTLGSEKTIIIGQTPGPNGEAFRCTLNLEMSNAAVAPVPDNEWAPVATYQAPGDQVVAIAAKWLRIRRSSSLTPAGTPTCDIGANDDGASIVNLPATAGDGSGANVAATTLGPFKTVTIGGAFRGNVNIEISDDGTHFSPVFSFTNNGGMDSATFTANWLRVSRDGTPVVSPGLPIVNIGAANEPSGGGGGGGLQFFAVPGIVGVSSYAVLLPAPRANPNYEVIAIVNTPGANAIKAITIDPSTITNVGFTAVLSIGAEAGDVLVFLIHDL
jgi:hypothetical protein